MHYSLTYVWCYFTQFSNKLVSLNLKEMEQTFIMIKPDGVQRGLVGEIISRFEKKCFSLKGLKLMTVDRPFAEKHYEDLLSKPFFGALIGYITSGLVIAMIWEGAIIVIILNFFNK